MTIQEAINSGKPFRRKGWEEDWLIIREDGSIVDHESKKWLPLTTHDIFAKDWEIQPEIIEFECEWGLEGTIAYPYSPTDIKGGIHRFVGKRTRVRVEVLP